LGLILSGTDADADALEDLQSKYTGQWEMYQRVLGKFYDRIMTLKVGVLLDFLKLAAAYRFYTLSDYTGLDLSPDVSVEDLRRQLVDLASAVRDKDENWDKDFQSQ